MKRSLPILFLLVLAIAACKPTEEPKPALTIVRQSIGNGDTVSVASTEISYTFSQAITLGSTPNITLNGQQLTATVASQVLKLAVALERGTTYTLTIPAGTVTDAYQQTNEAISLRFYTAGSNRPDSIAAALVTPNPSAEAVNVYNFLKQKFGNALISGTMANVNWNTNEAQWVYAHTGKYPALNCFDFVHHHDSPANWINYNNTQVVEDWWDNNGLVGAMWHWNVPKTAGSSDYAFYTDGTTFDINRAIIAGTAENAIILEDIDTIAGYLKALRDKNIPVIWRPLHEASGAWFWWGAKGASSYVSLWRLLYDRMVNVHGLNNLIWVWTSETNDPDWYPGDNYVDIVSCDIYNKATAQANLTWFDYIRSEYPNKMATLSEFGNVAAMNDQWQAGAKWSWMMPWYDYDRSNNPASAAFNQTTHQYADIAFWNAAMAQPYFITRDEMPSLK